MTSGTLYLIPNRISLTADVGSLAPEALAAARGCRRFLAENARSARAFLKSISHPGPIAELEIIEIGHDPDPALLSAWLEPVAAGQDTAIVSESGCPAVADPGAVIVARAETMGIRVRPMTGPCSILLTLMASGMNGQCFAFTGYLPVKSAERREKIKSIEKISRQMCQSQIIIETPYRNQSLFEELIGVCNPDTRLCVAANITMEDEFIKTRTVARWRSAPVEIGKRPCVFVLMA